MKVFRPWAFQGSKKFKNYFEGWYFKHVSAGRNEVYSIIPGISLSGNDSHSFVQVLNGLTGEAYYFKYPVSDFYASSKKLSVKVGPSSFTDRGINLDLNDNNSIIKGKLSYDPFDHYPSSLTRPGIMGWYSFVPFMECKHGIISTGHGLGGKLQINDIPVDFSEGRGYIEKDWGKSFPEGWVWLHCNTFNSSDASFTFSVAKIPWLGSYFIGFISYLRFEERFFNFSTWSKAQIERLEYIDDRLEIIISNKNYRLEVKAVNKMPGDLRAPVKGSMTRLIKESVDAAIDIKITGKAGNTIFRDEGNRAGMEITDMHLLREGKPANHSGQE